MPRSEHPRPQTVRMLEHEYSSAGRVGSRRGRFGSLALTMHDGRAALVLEDPGGEPLATRAGAPIATCRGPAHRCRSVGSTSPAARPRLHPQGHQTRQRDDRRNHGSGVVAGIRHRVATPARAPPAGAAGVHRRHARLHGAGADGLDESIDRCAQRPLRARRRALRTVDRQSPVHRVGSDGVGARPHRAAAGAAGRAADRHTRGRSRRS